MTRRYGITLLARSTRTVGVDDLYLALGSGMGRRILESAGIVAEPDSGADLSTAITSARWARIAGQPGATLVVSGDRDSGYVYIRVRGSIELVGRARVAFDELEGSLRDRYPTLRMRRKR